MNVLNKEDSPYLKQHENNPVHWQPWGEEALARGRREKKPIFVSIGYSTCHWCHVMEREVFEKEEFAKTLNEHFISIKIDKEERADIDKYYQEVFQILNKRAGGWPLSMILTHEGKPFFAGTYIPPTPRHGMMGFNQLLEIVLEKYESNYDDIVKTGETLTSLMSQKRGTEAGSLDKDLTKKIEEHLEENYDKEYGGFSAAPKFPHGDSLLYILDSKNETLLKMAETTLKKMSEGGLFDVVEGGFCRYSVDEMWLVPHFEKMLYDNALLTEVFTKAYFKFGDEYFRKIAIENADFMIEKMSEKNLFYSASDADTEGEEGKYFVYSYEELEERGLSKEVLDSLGVTKSGNFEGKNIIRTHHLDESVKKTLVEIRSQRVYPFIDKKIVVFQNAMMIKTLFLLGKVDSKYLLFAKNSLESLREFLNKELIRSKIANNQGKIEGFLEDYAYFCDAALVGYIYSLEEKFLLLAFELWNKSVAKFFDNGVWYFSKGDFPTLADIYDNSYPSAIGMMMSVGRKLSLLDEKIEAILEQTVKSYSEKISQHPFATTTAVRSLNRTIVKISGEKEKLKQVFKELNPLEIESVVFELSSEKNLSLCDEKSCFLETNEVKTVIDEVKKRV